MQTIARYPGRTAVTVNRRSGLPCRYLCLASFAHKNWLGYLSAISASSQPLPAHALLAAALLGAGPLAAALAAKGAAAALLFLLHLLLIAAGPLALARTARAAMQAVVAALAVLGRLAVALRIAEPGFVALVLVCPPICCFLPA